MSSLDVKIISPSLASYIISAFSALHILPPLPGASSDPLILGALGPNGVNEYVIPVIRCSAWVIPNLFDLEGLLGHLHESEVCSSPPLEAEIAHRIRTQKVLKRCDEEGKCGLEIDAISGEDDIGFQW